MGNRWPGWVYEEGEEPDYRFSFANERTFLAWVRTAMALLAAGVAIDVVDLDTQPWLQSALAALLVALGLMSAVVAWWRWALAERAMRQRAPLPSFGFAAVLILALVVTALVLVAVGV